MSLVMLWLPLILAQKMKRRRKLTRSHSNELFDVYGPCKLVAGIWKLISKNYIFEDTET